MSTINIITQLELVSLCNITCHVSPEDQPVGGSFTWLVIVASCIGAIMLLGAAIAMMLYHRRKKRGQLLLYDDTLQANETNNGHNFENPVYETID